MNESYDAIILGTGLKECILSGLLSTAGKKVLHIDRNSYYGGESASLNLTLLWEKFKGPKGSPQNPDGPPHQTLGQNREWNIDLVPKFVMAQGNLVKLLLHTGVTRYLEWKKCEGTFVYKHQEAGMLFGKERWIHKVPATDQEALMSNLMSMMEKKRVVGFLKYVDNWDENNRDTWGKFDPNVNPMGQVYEEFGLVSGTIDFFGHCVALHTDDNYLMQPCGVTLKKMKLYMSSLQQHGTSPFIYPIYGLSTLPEGFARLSAIYGGTYMLNKPIEGFEYDSVTGKVCGVRDTNGEVASAPLVICDPSYAPDTKKRAIGQVIRAICILKEPLPETEGRASCQIIFTSKEMNRNSDIYVLCVSHPHCVCSQGKYIAIVSATVETPTPDQEIKPVLQRLGNIEHIMCTVSTLFMPTDAGADGIFVTSSLDPTSHFESASEEVLLIWRHMTGEELVLTEKVLEDEECQ